MARIISFRTSLFDPGKERPNPINPIAGESVLVWLRENAFDGKFSSTEPNAEDWGWYIEVSTGESKYLVGAGGEFEDYEVSPGSELEWLVQVHKQRTLKEKLLGRNKLRNDDPLVVALVGALRGNAAFVAVKMESDA